jgi:hypothetical protein
LRHREVGNDANQCLPVLLRVYRLRREAAAEAGRLLRVLFPWLGAVSTGSGGAFGRGWRGLLLCRVTLMANDAIRASNDWLGRTRTNALAWWVPQAAIVAGLLVPVPGRAAIWIIALIWMGTACILNAKRCGRTHCRYTGPYYLAMIAPVLVLASGIYGWLLLGVLILGGSKIIWWATERAWGKFS